MLDFDLKRKKEQLRNKLSKLGKAIHFIYSLILAKRSLLRVASLRKGVAKLKMPFSRREGEDSTSPDENGDKKREVSRNSHISRYTVLHYKDKYRSERRRESQKRKVYRYDKGCSQYLATKVRKSTRLK